MLDDVIEVSKDIYNWVMFNNEVRRAIGFMIKFIKI